MIIIFNLISVCAHAVNVIWILAPMTARSLFNRDQISYKYHIALITGAVILLVQCRKIAYCVRGLNLPALKLHSFKLANLVSALQKAC